MCVYVYVCIYIADTDLFIYFVFIELCNWRRTAPNKISLACTMTIKIILIHIVFISYCVLLLASSFSCVSMSVLPVIFFDNHVFVYLVFIPLVFSSWFSYINYFINQFVMLAQFV